MKPYQNQSNWLMSAMADSFFIVGPPFLILLFILLFPHHFDHTSDINPLLWLVVVLGIDVSHVYSTLYRTYFEPETFLKHKQTLLLTPLIVWIVGVLCYSIDSLVFWRIMAYLAVFHFIRQQYGFLRIYAMKEERPKWFVKTESIFIYSVTCIPVVIWHLSGDRNFVWFVPNDFILTDYASLVPIFKGVLFLIITVYSCSELYFCIQQKTYNIAKYMLLIGTFISWYFGIVYFNSDLIFTLFNVICHGIPYIFLIWIYGNKKSKRDTRTTKWYSFIFSYQGILVYLFTLLILAYLEEGIWNGMFWHDHDRWFSLFNTLPSLEKNIFATLIIPLLSIPQVTHYVIDGFIWKIKNDRYGWKKNMIDG